MATATWRGLDAPRMEVVRLERQGQRVHATGTQLGAGYELRYELTGDEMRVEIVGQHAATVELAGCDFFDLGHSPLFNSLPVWRDGLLDTTDGRDYVMRWVSVPELEVIESPQRYEPLGDRMIAFRAGEYVAGISFDDAGLVVHYEGLAERIA